MALTPAHVTVGASICLLIPNPWASLPLAFLSHVILDLFPEWSNHDKRVDQVDVAYVLVEGLLGLAAVGVLTHLGRWELWAGAVAANLIDLWDFVGRKARPRTHKSWFCHGGTFPFWVNWPGGELRPLQTLLLDVLWVGLALGFMLR